MPRTPGLGDLIKAAGAQLAADALHQVAQDQQGARLSRHLAQLGADQLRQYATTVLATAPHIPYNLGPDHELQHPRTEPPGQIRDAEFEILDD